MEDNTVTIEMEVSSRITINVAASEPASTVDGPGVRTVLWVQGCNRNCPGCQNTALHEYGAGKDKDAVELGHWLHKLNSERAGGSGLYTITGGEPMDQALGVATVIAAIRELDPGSHVIVYTGYTFESVDGFFGKGTPSPQEFLWGLVLGQINVLVDGPYIAELDSDHMQYVGSSNQRAIDMKASLALYLNEVVTLDWESAGLVTIENGVITGAKGWLEDTGIRYVGDNTESPKCGQAERG